MSWNAGYVTDVNYTFGYYAELNAERSLYALQSAGIKPPTLRNACELGFGQGLSLAIHAAAQPNVQWWGTDFNPSQASFARNLIERSGSSAKVYDQAFAEFCARDDLPEFELIALHGIWTWVSDENRAIIVDFVRRKLAIGGILYMSYNTLPGWSVTAPLRHVMKQHSDLMGSPAALVTQRVDGALEFLDRLFAVDPAYGRSNTIAVDRFKAMKTQDRNYMAHEYMNRDWRPMYFADVEQWFEPAKVTFGTPANLLDQQESVNMLPAQSAFLAEIVDPSFRETVRDYITGNQFRRDLWLRGIQRYQALEQAEVLRTRRFLLVIPREEAKLTLNGHQGEVTLQEAVYKPVLDLMADHQIRTFAQIEVAMRDAGLNLGQVAAALSVLAGAGTLAIAQDDKTIAKAKPATEKLNGALISMARVRHEIPYLASPVTGGGIQVNRLEQLMLLARAQGGKTRADWANFAWDILKSQGQTLVKEGQQLEGDEANLAELNARGAELEKRMPLLRVLGII